MSALPNKRISKSTMSMFLRTGCDRELYLSLFTGKKEVVEAAGIPVPLKSRPGIQIITKSGQDFEREQNEMLIRELPGHVVYDRSFSPIDLNQSLAQAAIPSLIIQPAIEPEDFRQSVLSNLGVPLNDQQRIPRLSGMRPDVIYLDQPKLGDWEVLPNGSRKAISGEDERKSLCVVDLKNVQEGNASYSAEVCLYTLFLSTWVHENNLSDRYYVSQVSYLWSNAELVSFEASLKSKTVKTYPEKIRALVSDWEPVNYLLYIPSVIKFFKEDVIRVIDIGDSSGWANVSFHISPRCNSCDWLGVEKWLNPSDKEFFQRNPTYYCSKAAETSDHLCRIAGLSRGAGKILSDHGVHTVNDLITVSTTAPKALGSHAFLKRERKSIEIKAKSLLSNQTSIDASAVVAGLAKDVNLEIDIAVNFDPSSGYLTGIGLRANLLFPFGVNVPPERLAYADFVVPKDNLSAEWGVIQSFIEQFVGVVERANTRFEELGIVDSNRRKLSPRTQIYFWEQRQYDELCKAFGRHLSSVLSLSDKKQCSLAWLFPPEELVETEAGEISPAIIFIQQIIQRVVHTPVPYAYTLLGVADEYHLPALPPLEFDSYYREPLGNGIPRERIFEIWKSNSGVFSRGSRTVMVHDAINAYGKALRAQAYSIATIVARLRDDFKTKLKGKAKVLPLKTVGSKQGIADDSMLWNQWDLVNAATSRVERMCEFTYHGESLEASYKAIVLTRKLDTLGNNHYVFEVSEDSTESKIEESRFLVLGLMSQPGFPIRNGYSFVNQPGFPSIDPQQLSVRTNRLVGVELVHFDRINRRAEVRFWSGYGQKFSRLFDAVMNSSSVNNCDSPIFLMEGEPYDDSKTTIGILREMGQPPIAKADLSAITALGRKSPKKKVGTDPVTPISAFLWEAKTLAKNSVRDNSELTDLLNKAKTVNQFPINESQLKAVKGCAKQQLGIIWGPPGTGKTDTLSALIHSTIDEAVRMRKGKKILITGPNYRAVEELTGRLIKSINSDSTVPCHIYMGYSRSRDPQPFPDVSNHIVGGSLRFTATDPLFHSCKSNLEDPTAITVVATSAHAIPGFVKELGYSKRLVPLFDFAVIDESSQVPVSLGLRPLAVLKQEGQLTVAGDHKQMPPIFSLDAPAGAEYLVGSIQSYFLERFKVPTFPLLINYRSCQSIVDYAKLLEYPQELRAENPNLKLHRINNTKPWPATLPSSRLFDSIIDPCKPAITLVHEDIASSQANPDEADLVVSIVWSLYSGISASLDGTSIQSAHAPNDLDSFFDKAVGIVTPHKAQKALIISKLRELFPTANQDKLYASVDTVERFQGGQRQTIIVSFGVGDTDIIEGEEEFLLQLERTNVSVSRAMAKCIMIMPKSLAYHLPGDKSVAKSAIAIKSYIDEFCGERDYFNVDFHSGTREVEIRWHSSK